MDMKSKAESISSKPSFIQESKAAFTEAYTDVKAAVKHFFNDFPDIMKGLWAKIAASDKWQLVGMLTVCAFLCFVYELITNGGVVAVNGDYRLQGMAFIYNGYDDWHYFFSTGVFPLWDTSGALGVDNITGYSFYYLFDPFFLALLIWPRAWLSQMQAVFMIVKIVLAGLFFYDYLGSFHITRASRKIGGIVYAFCGWGWFYLWFFHMAEIVTFLPLMLWGVEKIIQKKDPRLFTVGAFLMGATNYQFLAIFMVFSFFYAMFRFFQTMKLRTSDENFSVLGLGVASFMTGIMLCCFIIVPSFLRIQSMPRMSSSNTFIAQLKACDTIWEKLSLCFVWPESYRYRALYPLESILYFTNSCFNEPLTNLAGGYYDNAGSSLYVSTPFLLLIIPSLIDAFKKKQKSQLIAFVLLLVALECPLVYYAAGGFSSVPYGRWELFVVICLVTFICLHLDNLKNLPRLYLDVSFIINAALLCIVTLYCYMAPTTFGYAHGLQDLNESKGIFTDLYLAAVIFQAVWMVVCYLFLRFMMYKKQFRKDLFLFLAVEAIIGGNIAVQGQTTVDYDTSALGGRDVFTEQTNVVEKIKEYDPDSFYRIYNSHVSTSGNFDPNLAMAEGYNGLGTFCSVINYDSEEFFEWSRLDHNSDSYMLDYMEKRINLDELLGIKYYMVDADDTNIPYGFEDVTTLADCPDYLKDVLNSSDNTSAKYKVYKNKNFVDRAFAFDGYMLSSTITNTGCEADVEANYLKRAIVDADYYDENEEDFEGFTYYSSSESYLPTGSYRKKANFASKAAFYKANWDYDTYDASGNKNSGGILRTLSTSESDAEYSKSHQDELQNSIDSLGSLSPYAIHGDKYRSDGGKIYYYKQNAANGFESNGETVTNGITSFQATSSYYSRLVIDGGTSALLAPDASAHSGAYVTLESVSNGANIAYYLYGENGNLLAGDDGNYVHQSTWKRSRGFYVQEPVYKIVGLVLSSTFNSQLNSGTYEYLDEYQSDCDELLANAVSVDQSGTDANTLSYSSDYDDKKIVVLNTLYSTGFSLKKTYTDESTGMTLSADVPLFKADGGLLGYVASSGPTEYVLTYYTEGLSLGLQVTFVGLVFQGALFIGFSYFNSFKKIYARLSKYSKFKKDL